MYNAYPSYECSWRKEFRGNTAANPLIQSQDESELFFSITNPTDRDYEGFDLRFWTDESIVNLKQITHIQCMQLDEENSIAIPEGYNGLLDNGLQRFRCPMLPSHSTIQFRAALLNIDPALNAANNKTKTQGLLFGLKRKPAYLIINADYKVAYRPYKAIAAWH
jgi:hypothetical protein